MESMKLENYLRIKTCQVRYLKETGKIILNGCMPVSTNLSKNSEKYILCIYATQTCTTFLRHGA